VENPKNNKQISEGFFPTNPLFYFSDFDAETYIVNQGEDLTLQLDMQKLYKNPIIYPQYSTKN
jgi:hypothetical protein